MSIHRRFTDEGKVVLELALREALSLGRNFVGPEHICLGLLRAPTDDLVAALAALGVSVESLRAEVVRREGRIAPQRQKSFDAVIGKAQAKLTSASQEFAGSGATVNIYGIPTKDAGAIGNAAYWEALNERAAAAKAAAVAFTQMSEKLADATEVKSEMADDQVTDEQVEETTTETLLRVSTESYARRREAEMHAFRDRVTIAHEALREIELAHAGLSATRDALARAAREGYAADYAIGRTLQEMRTHNKKCAAALEKAEALLPPSAHP